MACPYFCPTRRLEAPAWRGKIRPPLGDAFEGECRARADEPHLPPRTLLLEGCNLGYAARQCRRFPEGDGPDAVRFCLQADTEEEVRIDYVLERGHLPFEHGRLAYDRALKSWKGLQAGSLLERQAGAYLESYLAWTADNHPNGEVKKAKRKRAAAASRDESR